MKKAFTLALVGALGLGAAAVAIPATLSNTATPPARVDEAALPIIPDNIPYSDGFNAVWNPLEGGFDITIKMPTQGSYYDADNVNHRVDLVQLDKVVVTRKIDYSGEPVEVKTFENVPAGSSVSFFDKIDDRTVDYYYIVNLHLGDKTDSYPSSKYAGEAKSLPEAPKNVSYTTNQGMAPVTISFTAPEYYKGTQYIMKDNINKIVLFTSEYNSSTWSYETKEYGTLENVAPGSQQQFVIKEIPEEGNYNFRLKAEAYDGESDVTMTTVVIGKDSPAAPKSVTAVENTDGTITVSWDAVTTGVLGGYFDPSEVSYKLYATVGSESRAVVAEGLTTCSYTYDISSITEPTKITFGVDANTPKGYSSITSAPTLIVGPASTIPFVETFNLKYRESDKLWSFDAPQGTYISGSVTDYIYAGGGRVYPVGGEGAGCMFNVGYYNSHAGLNSYYTSAKIDVTGFEKLALAFQLLHLKGGYDSAADAQIAFDGGEFISVVRGEMTGATDIEWVKYHGEVEVPAGAKTAVIRMVLEAGKNPTDVCIDEISLRDPAAAVTPYPASASDLTAVYDYEANNVTIKFKAPTLTHHSLGEVNDQPLEYITRIDLLRAIGYDDYTVIKSYDNPEPGAEIEYIDTDLAVGGEYKYKVIVYVDENCDFGQFLDKPVKVGQRPADATNLKAVSDKGAAPVTLTFTAPLVDEDAGELREIKSIKIRRKPSSDYYGFADKHNISELTDVKPGQEVTYIDNDAEENYYYNYQVVVCGTGGDSYGRQVSIFLGKDTPRKPSDVLATVNEDKTITITWTAPTEGINDGYIDFENLTYTILVGSNASDYDTNATEIATGVKGNSYTYTGEFEEQQAIRFFVKADNQGSVGESEFSNTIVVGNPSTLPFVERFNEPTDGYYPTFNKLWATSAENSTYQFSCSNSTYIGSTDIDPVNNDGGLVYVSYYSFNESIQDHYLTSGDIDVEGHDVVAVTFYYFAMPGYETSLELGISFDGSEYYQMWDQDFNALEGTSADAAWQKVEIPVATGRMNAKTISLQFHSHKGVNACTVALDDVTVFALPAPKLEANAGKLTWSVEPNEFAELTGFRLFKKNEDNQNELHSSHAADVTSHEPGEEGTFSVTALYGENLETLNSNEVELKLDGIGSVVAGNVTVKALAGNIVVAGAEGLAVSIATVDGRVIYSAEGDATVSVVPGIYLVKVADTAVKLNVR